MTAVDRDALIEAAMKAVEREVKKYPVPEHGAFRGSIGWGASATDLGRAATDAILPLIADAIEALKVDAEDQSIGTTGRTLRRVQNEHYDHAADLVRSLLGDTGGDR